MPVTVPKRGIALQLIAQQVPALSSCWLLPLPTGFAFHRTHLPTSFSFNETRGLEGIMGAGNCCRLHPTSIWGCSMSGKEGRRTAGQTEGRQDWISGLCSVFHSCKQCQNEYRYPYFISTCAGVSRSKPSGSKVKASVVGISYCLLQGW